MAIFRRNGLFFSYSPTSLLSRLQALVFEQQRWTHTTTGDGGVGHGQDGSSFFPLKDGLFDTSNWRIVNSKIFGIRNSAISSSTWTVLKILQGQGFEAYLVGGCVRDLILGKTPKDFDVVTTATLEQIKKQFHRCIIVGRRFPICQVFVFGSQIEVSSFETTHIDTPKREPILFSQMPSNCDKKDFVRWKDCMRRDFTINGLFFDPFVNTIYDYADGIKDVVASEVRTLIPAHLSFTEDCARILRGLRIVARLGLHFSKDTATAVQELSWSIVTLSKARLMMELNFMLAYGAAVPSICLLQKYKLLDALLPLQAAYLADQNKQLSGGSSIMLMKLFSHVDKLLSADRPSDCTLWLGLLAFHLALVNYPQDALVIWTFASILYLGSWDRAIKFVRKNVRGHVQFVPEILELSGTKSDGLLLEETKSDESLLEKTSHLVSLIKSSIDAFTSIEALQESLTKYRMTLPCQDLGHAIFVSERAGRNVAKLFNVLEDDLKSYAQDRETFCVNYELLKRGDHDETRFVLGKVIFDMLNSELAFQESKNVTMSTPNGELMHQQNPNTSMYASNGKLTPQQNQNTRMYASNRHLIRQQNKNANASKTRQPPLSACKENAITDVIRGELIRQQNQNAILTMKGQPPPPACLKTTVVDAIKDDSIHQQNPESNSVKKIRSLSALF